MVLSRLTQLQELVLFDADQNLPVSTAEEAAALTASAQLTRITLGGGLPPQFYSHVFPTGRALHHLVEADISVAVLSNTAAVDRLVSSCPKLQQLRLFGEPAGDAEAVARSLAHLAGLTGLNKLQLYTEDAGAALSVESWQLLGKLTRLTSLEISSGAPTLQAFLQLTGLHRLQELCVDVDV